MAFYLSPIGNSQIVDVNGNPLSGGKIYTYIAGSTTPTATYTDSTGATPQSNPIILNTLGLPDNPIWLDQSAVKIIIKDVNDVQQGSPYDNIYGVGAVDAAVSFDEWVQYNNAVTYISPTSFSVVGDQRAIFQVNRRAKTQNTAGQAYSTILTSVYSAPNTTVTLTNTSGALDAGLSATYYGFMSAQNSSIPIDALDVYLKSETYSDTETDEAISTAIAALPTATPSTPFRNRCINGDFAVDQEYAGASTTFTAGAAYKRAIDMFYAWCTGANVTGQQVTVSGLNRYRFTGAASNTLVGFLHSMQADNSADMAGGDATFSVKLKSTSLTTVNWAAYYANTTDTFGTLASPTRTSIASGSFTITSTEARYAATFAVPSGATTGIEIALTTGALTAGNTLDVGEFQPEKGAIALADIEFEKVDIALQEARCRHGFFEKVQLVVDGAAAYKSQMGYTPKRTTPTLGTPTFNTGSGATFTNGEDFIHAVTNHSTIAAATIPLTCGLHG